MSYASIDCTESSYCGKRKTLRECSTPRYVLRYAHLQVTIQAVFDLITTLIPFYEVWLVHTSQRK